MRVFIDTSAFCALTIPKDQHNSIAKIIYKQIQKDNYLINTSDYVLDEVYTLLKTRSSHATAVKFMNEYDSLLAYSKHQRMQANISETYLP